HVGKAVTKCSREGVEFGGGFLAAGTIIWAAGVVASPAAAWLRVPHDKAGRVPASPDLSAPGLPEVFVIGDAAAVPTGPNRIAPGLAAASKPMGRSVGGGIAARARRGAFPAPFRHRQQGDL